MVGERSRERTPLDMPEVYKGRKEENRRGRKRERKTTAQ
jgi:hypothetical protein